MVVRWMDGGRGVGVGGLGEGRSHVRVKGPKGIVVVGGWVEGLVEEWC